jgi:general secretion pathway protein D
LSRAILRLGMLLAVGALCTAEDAAGLFKQAEQAERAGDRFHAYLLYAQAAALEPSNAKFQERFRSLAAAAAYSAATNQKTADPASETNVEAQLAAGLSPAEVSTLPQALPPPRLKPSSVKAKFDLRGKAQDIAERVAAAYGVKVEVEGDYQAPPDFLFRTGELGMVEAFRALEAAANSLIIPLDDHTVLLARDVPQRRADSEPVMSLAIPIPERIAAQDAQEIVTAVQQTLEIRRIQADPQKRMVYLRDVVGKAIAARQLFFDLCRLRGQVAVEVELISIDKNSSLNIGLNLPTSTQIVNFGNWLNNANAPSVGSFTNFLTFGGGKTLFGIGVANAAAFATLQRSSSVTLLHAEIVALDGQAGSLHVGDHYPIVTSAYVGATSTTGYVPAPTVNFVDLGLVLKVTPSMHESGEITLDVDAEFNVLGSATVNNIPSIGQQKYTGKVRLASDQWAVIAGLIEDDRSVNTTGLAGLARIPLLGHLFRQDTYTKDHTELMIILKPRVVELPPWEFPTRTLWVGTEGKPLPVY